MRYLLDTSACIEIMNGKRPEVRERLRRSTAEGDMIYVSSVVLFELQYGVARSRNERKEEYGKKLKAFFSDRLPVLPFGEAEALAAAQIRAELERTGSPIGAYDLLIAGQALAGNLTLVTGNVSEFGRVGKLKWENWERPRKVMK